VKDQPFEGDYSRAVEELPRATITVISTDYRGEKAT
jgi:hypothetical protein